MGDRLAVLIMSIVVVGVVGLLTYHVFVPLIIGLTQRLSAQ